MFRLILESWALIPATSINFMFGVSHSSPESFKYALLLLSVNSWICMSFFNLKNSVELA